MNPDSKQFRKNSGRVILSEQPIYLRDIQADAEQPPQPPGNRVSSGVRSYLGVPLVAEGRAIGLLQVDSTEADAWTDEEQSVFLGAAPIVAAAIQTARAHAQVSATIAQLEQLDRRLTEAGELLADARRSIQDIGREDLDRLLSHVQAMLSRNALKPDVVALPGPRPTEGVPTVS